TIARDSCLLALAAATGTLVTRAEEFMHNERVIAHSRARTLSLAPHTRCFFYLLLRCTKSLFRACHIWQKCESSNRLNTLVMEVLFGTISAHLAQCGKSNVDAVFAVARRKSRATF